MRKIVNFCDFFIIVSAAVDRQVRAIAEAVTVGLEEKGERLLHSEGESSAKWILLDFGDSVVHIFERDTRSFYDLEHLWQDAPRVSFKTRKNSG